MDKKTVWTMIGGLCVYVSIVIAGGILVDFSNDQMLAIILGAMMVSVVVTFPFLIYFSNQESMDISEAMLLRVMNTDRARRKAGEIPLMPGLLNDGDADMFKKVNKRRIRRGQQPIVSPYKERPVRIRGDIR